MYHALHFNSSLLISFDVTAQGTLFRGSTIATQFLHVFLKNVGTTYLKSLTSNILSEIYAKNNSFEVPFNQSLVVSLL